MTDHARYGSLRDYLRVLRTQSWVILLVVLVAAGGALGWALRQDNKYEAKATMTFQDISQDLGLIGQSVPSRDSPLALAAQSALTIKRSDVVERVRASLNTTLSTSDLRDALTAEVEPTSNLVNLTSEAEDPQLAADIANAFAREAQSVFNASARSRFTRAARALRRRYRSIRRSLQPSERIFYQGQISRLESLGSIVNAASIAELARPNEDAVSPKPIRNLILGIVLGLCLGIVLAFVRDALDRRLRTAADVRRELDLPVIGYVAASVFSRRMVDPKTGQRSIADMDLEAFRIMRRNLEFLDVDRPAKVVAVSSPLPQEGKTTVAVSLAIAAATGGKRVLLLECDLRHPTLPGRIGAQEKPGLADYLVGDSEPSDVLQIIEFSDPHHSDNGHGPRGPQLAYVSAGSPTPEPAELLASQRFEQLLSDVREVYDLVIVDTPPMLPVVDTLEIFPQVDALILCIRVRQTTRDQALGARQAIARFPERPVGIVVTGTSASDESAYGAYGTTYAYKPRVSIDA